MPKLHVDSLKRNTKVTIDAGVPLDVIRQHVFENSSRFDLHPKFEGTATGACFVKGPGFVFKRSSSFFSNLHVLKSKIYEEDGTTFILPTGTLRINTFDDVTEVDNYKVYANATFTYET